MQARQWDPDSRRSASRAAHLSGADACVSPCPLCGAACRRPRFRCSDRLFHTTDKQFRVVECGACGALYLEPRPSLEELAAYYPPGYWWSASNQGGVAGRLEGLYRRVVLRDQARFLARAAGPPPARILDVGCGSGDLLVALRRRGYACVGMDCALTALSAAKAQGLPAVLGDYRASPLGPNLFDLVSMFHFLEHVADPSGALAFAHQALRPQGRLVVQAPNAACWQLALLGARWSGLDVPRHLVDFRACDLERVVERSGFRILRRKHFSLRDNPAALATSLAPGWEPVSRRSRRREGVARRLGLDLAYFALVLAALPFSMVEAAAGRGFHHRERQSGQDQGEVG